MTAPGSPHAPGRKFTADRPELPAPAPTASLDVVHGRLEQVTADALVVNLFEGVATPGGAAGAVDSALGGAISELIAAGDLSGRLSQVAVLYPRGALAAKRLLVVGLGKPETFGAEAARRAAASAALRARELGATSLATVVHRSGSGDLDLAAATQSTVEGSLLATYRFAGWKQGTAQAPRLHSVMVVESDAAKIAAVSQAATAAQAVVAGAYLARDLVNAPPNVVNPSYMADTARAVALRHGFSVEVGGTGWAEERNMGAFVAVSRGSENEPAFIVMEHNAGRTDLPLVALVGKGVTFDTGGLSLKTRDGMLPMKNDMSGAAAVLGAMEAVGRLALPLRVVAICPCVENMPDGKAFRPSDVVIAGNGKSIEIFSTDAEGRLALADALVYAQRYRPEAVIDIATLTGASVTAMGAGVSASLFVSDDSLAAELLAASAATGERIWRMPLFEDYRETIDAKVVADLKNQGGATGGVGTAAVFLQEFTGGLPWAHVDMAGMGSVDTVKGRSYLTLGATGYGVRLLVEYLRRRAGA